MKDFTLDEIKEIIGTEVWFKLTYDDFLDNRYQAHIDKFGNAHCYYRLFYHLAKQYEPALVVELGGWQGTAAAHFASGHSRGKVITIDHHTDPGDDVHKGKMLEAEGRYPNLYYIQAWTWDALPMIKEEFNIPVDILFIDSWHQYEYAKRDWEDYSPLLASPSLVICDDILGGEGAVIGGMDRFWEELPGEKFLDGNAHPGFPMGFMKYE